MPFVPSVGHGTTLAESRYNPRWVTTKVSEGHDKGLAESRQRSRRVADAADEDKLLDRTGLRFARYTKARRLAESHCATEMARRLTGLKVALPVEAIPNGPVNSSDLRGDPARHFNLRFSARRRDTKPTRTDTKKQHCPPPRHSDEQGQNECREVFKHRSYAMRRRTMLHFGVFSRGFRVG